jgi:hypothetical protein
VIARPLTASLLFVTSAVLMGAQTWRNTAPESFRANGQITGASGGAASAIEIKIERYTTDAEEAPIEAALKAGGHDAFMTELKKAAPIGSVKVGPRSFTVRWARETPKGDSRHILVVTDAPVFFAGGGAVDAKPTAGYDIAVVEFTVDSVGLGAGTMAPAARVKPGPEGVQVDDYSGKRITLMSIARNSS